MHIKSIYIDGFKSYAKRTEISGFDPAFNAITGLNGSGKSNILDAICFLLGITNLSQVRASNLQDLVYKSGQAGVTKATVSIIFDNREKSESPVGYAQFDEITITRQIVIGGKNKYLINGINATNARVHDLFHSVQLNVNNPHFLIMQGRITKVLNMKPPEILSLLEEAASTKHYEAKREDTLKTIEKKDGKLREIDKILREEIKPTLAKLKEERSSYLEYQKVIRELEYLNKFIIAYDYFNKKAIVDNSDGELARMSEQQTTEEQTIIKCDRDKLQIEREIQEKTSERENVMVKQLEELHAQYSKLQKDEVILKNAIKRAEDGVKESMSHVKNLEKQSIEERETHSKLREEISKIESQFTELKNRVNKSKADLELAQNRLKNVNSGFFQSDESSEKTGSLSELLAEAEKFESSCEIELNVLKMKKNHLEKLVGELKEKLRGMKKNESAEIQEKKHGELKRKIDVLEQKILKCGYSKDKEEKLLQEFSGITRKIRETVTEKDQFFRSHQRLLFEYRKPSSNFDTKKIIGMVVKLVNLKDPQFNVAMEIGGGARLYDVVVDHSQTSVELISKKLLMKRTTFLPLNAMQVSPISKKVFNDAQQILGADNVWHPLELIDFDDQNTKAIQYVFGNFLIARDLHMANIVAFDPRIRCKCVTLDGEVFEPEGTLVGGNQPTDTKIYDQAKKSVEFDNFLTQLEIGKSNIEEELTNIGKARNASEEFQKDLRSNQVELQQLERRMMEDDYLEVQKNLTDNQNELGQITEKISVKSKQYEIAKTKTSEARHNLKNSALVQERAQQAAQLNLKNTQEQLMKNEEAFKDIEFRYESLTMELKENENEKKNFQSTLESANQLVTAKKEELAQSNTNFLNHTEIMTASKQKLDEQKRTVKNIDTKISQLKEGLKDCSKLKDQATLKLSEVNHRINCHIKDSEDAEKNVIKMLKKYNWINDEQKYFNQPGGIYDFNKRDWREAGQKIEQLEEQKRKLSRKVDLRGMNVLAQTEERYNDLMSKYVKVLQDKKILQTVIDELDKMKDKVIKKAHEQVDNDFNNIFSTLLPGSQARLVPPEGKTIIEGLEFKIAFGNVWKESLNELSGGQRSLVALSLILALLRFKPAPLYILDEVDAALDISHTQNIGTIIKEQFSNSQFIIVSLKDGMFNNANVLFKTKFVDGVSTVTRHARR